MPASLPDQVTDYGIALGSNLGDRLSHLHAALGALAGLGELRAVSAAWQTAPVDCAADAPAFLNAVVELRSALGKAVEQLTGEHPHLPALTNQAPAGQRPRPRQPQGQQGAQQRCGAVAR